MKNHHVEKDFVVFEWLVEIDGVILIVWISCNDLINISSKIHLQYKQNLINNNISKIYVYIQLFS